MMSTVEKQTNLAVQNGHLWTISGHFGIKFIGRWTLSTGVLNTGPCALKFVRGERKWLLKRGSCLIEVAATTVLTMFFKRNMKNVPRHDKTNKMNVRPVKTQISLGVCPV